MVTAGPSHIGRRAKGVTAVVAAAAAVVAAAAAAAAAAAVVVVVPTNLAATFFRATAPSVYIYCHSILPVVPSAVTVFIVLLLACLHIFVTVEITFF